MFNIGDTVKLKSGGPVMTIARPVARPTTGVPGYICVWFIDNKPEEFLFATDTLIKVAA